MNTKLSRRAALSLPTLALGLSAHASPSSRSNRAGDPVERLLAAYPRNWRRLGAGLLRFGPFQVYQAQLFVAAPSYRSGDDAVLDITYRRSVEAQSIVNASILEIGRVNAHTPEQLDAWSQAIRKAASSVKEGDRLTGVFLRDYGARFFKNDVLAHEVRDPVFSVAYLNIWLDPKAREQRLRRELLGLGDGAGPS
jgi:Chalcone isomerase-like